VKRDTINYFVVGVFVIVLFIVFLLVINRLTGSSGDTDEYSVYYENVTGMKYGTPVLFEGFQIGQVEEILPEFEDGYVSYRLRLSVIEDWKIQSDAVAKIVSSGLLSAISIDIKQGGSSQTLTPGDTIQGLGAGNLFATVNEVVSELHEITKNNIKPFIENLNQHVDLISGGQQNIALDRARHHQ